VELIAYADALANEDKSRTGLIVVLIFMLIDSYIPNNSRLKQHIEYYYFFKTDDSTFNSSYYAFPNIYTSVNIHKNINYNIEPYKILVSSTTEQNFSCIIQGIRQVPLFVQLSGIIDKVTIVFKPLGLNPFITKPYLQIAPEHSQCFSEWNKSPHFTTFLSKFYATNDNAARVRELEIFLLSILKEKEGLSFLYQAITLLSDFSQEHSINDISSLLNVSLRTFNREFKKHLGISPIGFRIIARFRHSLQSSLISDQFKRLTDVGYNSNYYDQAYFIKTYKKLTGLNPRSFLNSVEKLAGEKLIFQFLNQTSG